MRDERACPERRVRACMCPETGTVLLSRGPVHVRVHVRVCERVYVGQQPLSHLLAAPKRP